MDNSGTEVRPTGSKTTLVEAKEDAEKPKNRLDNLILGPIELFTELPEGIIAIFLASSTQELFKLKGGEHVTAEKPLKFVPKSDILSDLYARAAVSDFSPYKEFPGEEILLHYDADFKYGQNFLICFTLEATETLLKMYTPAVPDEEQTLDEAVAGMENKAPRQRGWISLGSEAEIEMEMVRPTREKIHVMLSKKRRDFGASAKFGDRDANDGFLECRPYRDPNFEINRMEIQTGIQAVPETISNSSQTWWNRSLNFSSQYEPAIMAEGDQEMHISSKAMEDFCLSVLIRFEHALQQNELSNIFYDDFGRLCDEDFTVGSSAQIVLQEYQSFTDLKHSKDKSISCINWHPTIKGVLAVACVSRTTLDERIDGSFSANAEKSVILIWSFNDPIHPQLILEAPDDVHTFQINPEEPNIIAAGCANGQIALWDISDYQNILNSTVRKSDLENGTDGSGLDDGKNSETPHVSYILCSSIEASHKAAITDLNWIGKTSEIGHNGEIVENPENGHKQFYACSLDGSVTFWDLRYKKDYASLDLAWRPFLRIPLTAMDNTFDYGVEKVSILCQQARGKGVSTTPTQSSSQSAVSKSSSKEGHSQTKFYAASEEGDLLYADYFNEKTAEEKVSRVESSLGGHFGPISDIHRSPFFPDIILSVGGWSFHIWKEKVNIGPLISSGISQQYILCGQWSPTRPGVFYITTSDGNLQVWDLLDKSHAPSTIQSVSTTSVSHISIHQYPGKTSSGQFIAAGDDDGTLHILEVPKILTRIARNEKTTVVNFFEREVKRLLYMQERKKIRLREKAAFDAALQAQVKPKPEETKTRSRGRATDDPNLAMENDYRQIETEFFIEQGMLKDEPAE